MEKQKRFEELSQILNPPAFQPTELDILKATLKFWYDNELSDTLYGLTRIIKGDKKFNPNSNLPDDIKNKEYQEYILKKTDSILYPEDKVVIQEGIEKTIEVMPWHDKKYTQYLIDGLSEYHGGDCTAIACSCGRCESERYFDIPNTARWGKASGNKMFNEHYKLGVELGKIKPIKN